jgi:hypothetical protein
VIRFFAREGERPQAAHFLQYRAAEQNRISVGQVVGVNEMLANTRL